MADRPVTTATLVTSCTLLLLSLPHASPQQPAGSGTITGVVVAADTGTPVKRANVMLTGPMGVPMRRPEGAPGGVVGSVVGVPGGVVGGVVIGSQVTMGGPRSTPGAQTNEAGQFEFSDLAPGRYSVMIAPAGGFVRPERPVTVEVVEGKPATLTIKLERTGAITGRVLDEGGEPLMQARVSALRKDGGTGGMRYATGGASTDDLGHFRIFNLPPGEYYVNARHTASAAPNVRGPSEGYGATYYPGVASLDGAQVVTVRSGQDAGNVDFSLVRVPLGRITGTVRDAAGQLAPRPGPGVMANVMVTSARKDGLGESRGGMIQPDGSYAINAIEPGEYVLNATITRGTGPDALREGAVVPVTVNGNEQTVDVTTNLGATLSGRVVIEGTPPQPLGRRGAPPPQAMRVNVSVRPVPGSMGGAVTTGRPATAAEDGTFEIAGVRGEVLLSAFGGPLMKSISGGGADLLAKPLHLRGTERVSDILITMTWDTGRIEGSVTNERGEPALEAWVVVFSEDESKWALGMPYVQLTRTLSEMPPPPPPGVTVPPSFQRRLPGSFLGMPLLPGRYYVAAVEGSREAFLRPEEPTLSKLRKVAVSVTVSVGGPTPVQLRAVKSF